MSKEFDTYLVDGRIVILTTWWNEHGEKVYCENFISLTRAKEILSELKATIDMVENNQATPQNTTQQ